MWEWSERQSKFVTNQQRIYDYNLNWYLPLWDKEYVDFWKEKLFELQDQKLYKYFLQKWNYKNLFDQRLNTSINPWIGYKKIIILIAKIKNYYLVRNIKIHFIKNLNIIIIIIITTYHIVIYII